VTQFTERKTEMEVDTPFPLCPRGHPMSARGWSTLAGKNRKGSRICDGPKMHGIFVKKCQITLRNGRGQNGNFCCDNEECQLDGIDLCTLCYHGHIILRVCERTPKGRFEEIKVDIGSDHATLVAALCDKEIGQQIVQNVGTQSAFYAITRNGVFTAAFCSPDDVLSGWRYDIDQISQLFEQGKKFHYVVLKSIQPSANEVAVPGDVRTDAPGTGPGVEDPLPLLRSIRAGETSGETSGGTSGDSHGDWFSKHVQCPICLDTQTDLRKTCAMHFVCYKCEFRLRDGFSKCPTCNKPLVTTSTRHTIPGDFVTLLEESMRRGGDVFSCPNGCDFNGTYTALQHHDKACPAKLVKCEHCPIWYKKGKELEHLVLDRTEECYACEEQDLQSNNIHVYYYPGLHSDDSAFSFWKHYHRLDITHISLNNSTTYQSELSDGVDRGIHLHVMEKDFPRVETPILCYPIQCRHDKVFMVSVGRTSREDVSAALSQGGQLKRLPKVESVNPQGVFITCEVLAVRSGSHWPPTSCSRCECAIALTESCEQTPDDGCDIPPRARYNTKRCEKKTCVTLKEFSSYTEREILPVDTFWTERTGEDYTENTSRLCVAISFRDSGD
jgi:hypothetical protein